MLRGLKLPSDVFGRIVTLDFPTRAHNGYKLGFRDVLGLNNDDGGI